MSLKTRIQNFRTRKILEREERKAENEEEKLYLRGKIREARERRRLKELDIKAEQLAKRKSRLSLPKFDRKKVGKALEGLSVGGGGSSDFGLDIGLPSLDLGFGSSRRRKGKRRRREDNFGGFI